MLWVPRAHQERGQQRKRLCAHCLVSRCLRWIVNAMAQKSKMEKAKSVIHEISAKSCPVSSVSLGDQNGVRDTPLPYQATRECQSRQACPLHRHCIRARVAAAPGWMGDNLLLLEWMDLGEKPNFNPPIKRPSCQMFVSTTAAIR